MDSPPAVRATSLALSPVARTRTTSTLTRHGLGARVRGFGLAARSSIAALCDPRRTASFADRSRHLRTQEVGRRAYQANSRHDDTLDTSL
jgi:hypothetical protein